METTHHGRLLTLNRLPVIDGLVMIATDEKGTGALRPDVPSDVAIPLDEPLIFEESEVDRMIVVRRLEGQPAMASFYPQ